MTHVEAAKYNNHVLKVIERTIRTVSKRKENIKIKEMAKEKQFKNLYVRMEMPVWLENNGKIISRN